MTSALESIFTVSAQDAAAAYAGHYDPVLVTASVLLAVFASTCAFAIANRLAQTATRHLWLPLGAAILGAGVWAMHFIGTLALKLNCGITYDPLLTGASVIPGVIAAGFALRTIASRNLSTPRLVLGSLIMAAGVGLMHYSGMAAMHLSGFLRYDPKLFVLSLLVAALLSFAALWGNRALLHGDEARDRLAPALVGGLLLGGAISAMHYVAMRAAYFIPFRRGYETVAASASPAVMATVVAAVALLLIISGSLSTLLASTIVGARRRVNAILEATSHGFVRVDRAGRIAECNSAMASLVRKEPSQLIGQPFMSLLAPRQHDILAGSYKVEARILCADGETVPCLVQGNDLPGDRGESGGAVAWFTDISAHVASEEALRARNKEFSALLESTPDPMVITDERGAIRMANRKALSVFGYSSDELIGKSVQVLLPPNDLLELDLSATESLSFSVESLERRATRGDLIAWSREGREVPVEISLNPIEGHVPPLLAIALRDATQRRRASELLNGAKAAAEEASQLKSAFLSAVLRQISTPMSQIVGLSDRLVNTAANDEQRRVVARMQDASQNLITILNEILDFSRIESSKFSMDHVPFNVHSILDHTVSVLRESALAKGLSLDYDLGDNIPRVLMGDPLRLGQILTNLCSNGVKFTEKGGVRIKVRNRGETQEAVTLKFTVQDTGIGIEPQRLGSLFKPFQQQAQSTGERGVGAGLGLAISKKLVDLMGGEIAVYPSPGGGTKVSFTLTLQRAAADLPLAAANG